MTTAGANSALRASPVERLALAMSLCLAALGGRGLAAQEKPPAGPYLDQTAADLHVAAVAHRERLDDRVVRYTATVRQRIAAALRTPLKDRTLYRMESSHRVFWSRDGDMLVQVLALREQTPTGVVEGATDQGLFDDAFDPMDDRLLFGLARREDDLGSPDEDEFRFEHPLYAEYRDAYRFRSADTLTLSLPDGRSILAVELQVVPVAADVHRMTGSLWVEPESGALVRAVYRLSDTFDAMRDVPDLREEEAEGEFRFVPGIFKPWTADLSLIAVDYSLWEFDVWLPRSLRAEGLVSAGILKAPLTVDLSYEIEAVSTEASLAAAEADDGVEEIRFRTRSEAFAYLNELVFGGAVPYELERGRRSRDGTRTLFLVPEDPGFLALSPELPPPIWEDATGFASGEDLAGYFEGLADLPVAPLARVPTTFRWGPQRPDLLRYNRVEALSVGARGQVRPNTPWGPLSITATARLGVADRHLNGRLGIARETLERRLTLSGYHELAAIDGRARHLGIGNSLLAATVGRDDGDYYRRSGASIEWTPPEASRRSYRLTTWAERHRAVAAETDFALFHPGSNTFRPNLAADDGWEYGGGLEVTPYWGTDPNLAQGGLDLTLQAATGDYEYARTALVGRAIFPLPSRLRMGLEVGAGTIWGSPSAQRLWYVGGPSTLRGYAPRAGGGTSFVRGRAELARGYAFGRLSVFSDLAWAGDRANLDLDDALQSVGVGLSILDGLIRLDGAWGLRSPRRLRLDAYLDQVL